MKMLTSSLVLSLGVLTSGVAAEVLVNVDGKEYTLTALMENCQSMGDNPAAQIACFNAVSALLEKQNATPPAAVNSSIPEALNALRDAAQYEDGESGLIVQGNECKAEILYYANYFHVSRRNVSTIDLFRTQFDASKIAFDETIQVSAGQSHMSKGAMQSGAVAATIGGGTIDSAQYNLAPKPGRMSIADYAREVANQLPANESGEFNFVLVHPAKQQSSTEIWTAFKAYVDACQRELS